MPDPVPSPSAGGLAARDLLFFWAPVAAYMGIIFALSARTRLPMEEFIALNDKALHAVEYAGLSLLAFRAFYHASPARGRTRRAALLGACLAALYALTDEWHQSFVPGRSLDPADLVADVAGAFSAALLAPFYVALLPARRA